MKNKADIFTDRKTLEVIVVDDKGREVFRQPKSEQTVSIGNALYMYHKYKNRRAE